MSVEAVAGRQAARVTVGLAPARRLSRGLLHAVVLFVCLAWLTPTVALLISYPWALLAVLTVAYLASLPFGVAYYKRLAAEHEASLRKPDASVPGPAPSADPTGLPVGEPTENQPPTRH